MNPAANTLAHIAINADDVTRTRAFYEAVFGWKFTPWGPPDFFQIDMGSQPTRLIAALQKRRALEPGRETRGFEPTIAVRSLAETEAAIVEHGGRIVLERSTIPGVGDLLFFADPSDNYVGAIEFVQSA